ncbi:MAG TPA: hypothetical protein PLX80_06950 [Ignavibacteria bacterium]|nr:hypothetical protein [Ignavibacteria bacterium]
MKKNKFLSLTIFISIFTISFFHLSCDNSSGPESVVSGIIHNEFHVPLSNVKVSTQGKTVLTSEDGSFNLSGISIPYDLTVSDSAFNLNTDIYKGLSASYLELGFNKYPDINYYAYINAELPVEIFQQDIICKVIFSDKEFTNIYSTLLSPNQNAILQVPVFNNVINGKVHVLTYKIDSSHRILSYENYGTSPEIVLNRGNVVNYIFTNDQLSLNPGEKDVECNIEPNNFSSLNSFYLTFSPKNYLYLNSTFSQMTGNNFQVKIPTGIPDAFYSVVNYNVGSTSGNISLVPNTNYIKVNSPCELISPPNNAADVNNSTPFSFSAGEGSGIYEITIFNNVSGANYKIFTTENNFTLNGLEETGNENFSGDNFTWFVSKKGTFSTVNDYAVNKFKIQNPFVSQSQNGFFTFK